MTKRPSEPRRRRGAFTLVELLAASALAAALMIASMQVIRAIGRPPASANRAAPLAAHGDLRELIRLDLANAYSVRPSHGAVDIAGYVYLDDATRAPTHRPAMASYSIRAVGGRRCLIRTQTPLGERSGRETRSDVVAWDVGAFDVEAVPRPQSTARADALAKLLGPAAAMPPRPPPIPAYFANLPGFYRVPDSVRVSFAPDTAAPVAPAVVWEFQLR